MGVVNRTWWCWCRPTWFSLKLCWPPPKVEALSRDRIHNSPSNCWLRTSTNWSPSPLFRTPTSNRRPSSNSPKDYWAWWNCVWSFPPRREPTAPISSASGAPVPTQFVQPLEDRQQLQIASRSHVIKSIKYKSTFYIPNTNSQTLFLSSSTCPHRCPQSLQIIKILYFINCIY